LLKKLVQDNETVLKKITSEDFKPKDEAIIEIIKEYNLAFFENKCIDKCVSNFVFVYHDEKMAPNESMTVTVNDGMVYKVPYNALMTIQLCNKHTSKVNFDFKGVQRAELLSGSPFYEQYYWIKKKKKSIKAVRKSLDTIERNIRFISTPRL
jgi:hypothetical protein